MRHGGLLCLQAYYTRSSPHNKSTIKAFYALMSIIRAVFSFSTPSSHAHFGVCPILFSFHRCPWQKIFLEQFVHFSRFPHNTEAGRSSQARRALPWRFRLSTIIK